MALEHKLVVLGEGGVGKSALSIQFVRNQFITEYNPTIEECYRKQVTIDGATFILDILDTAGQEEFSALRHQYMRQGHGFLIVYSIADKSSFEHLHEFYNNIYRVKQDDTPKGTKIPIIIVGNKCDLHYDRVVTTEQGQEFARSVGCQFVEASARNRIGVDEAYFSLVRKIRETQPKSSRVPWDETKKKRCVIL